MALSNSDYQPPLLLLNGHIQTIYPALFRTSGRYHCERYNIQTRDGDILVVDHHPGGNSRKAMVVCHGLEGHSRKPYVLGMARWYRENGWDVYAWNYRGCAEGPNRTARFYHSGATDDLDDVIQHVISNGFDTISLVGFSLGGNLILKYLGEKMNETGKIRSAVTFSVPLDLYAGALHLNKPQNRFYQMRFLKSLKRKIRRKQEIRATVNIEQLDRVRSLLDFDELYTAPIHGFADARDYYRKCSALYFLEAIRVPTLIVNAMNDPFLPPECIPYALVERLSYVHLEAPRHGGHTGFVSFNGRNLYWSEKRALKFSAEHV